MDGFYSLVAGEICKPCMDNAVCTGGSQVNVSSGYWRDKILREELVECYAEEACLGGYEIESKYPVKCEKGY